jgi:hypothetical protein
VSGVWLGNRGEMTARERRSLGRVLKNSVASCMREGERDESKSSLDAYKGLITHHDPTHP